MREYLMLVKGVGVAEFLFSTWGLLLVLGGGCPHRRASYLQVLLPTIGALQLLLGVLGLFVGAEAAEFACLENVVQLPVCIGHILVGAVLLVTPFVPRCASLMRVALVVLGVGVLLQALRCAPVFELLHDLLSPDSSKCDCEYIVGENLSEMLFGPIGGLLEPLRTFGPPTAFVWLSRNTNTRNLGAQHRRLFRYLNTFSSLDDRDE